MLTAVIPTHESERALVPTLAALVPGAMQAVVSEVIVADDGSKDATAEVANHAGCHLIVSNEPLGARLHEAAKTARSPWLLFLRPGCVPDTTWIAEVSRFIEEADASKDAATFRKATRATSSSVVDALRMLMAALISRPQPEQGLLISKKLYLDVGGHRAGEAEPEADLLRRLGRRVRVLQASAR